ARACAVGDEGERLHATRFAEPHLDDRRLIDPRLPVRDLAVEQLPDRRLAALETQPIGDADAAAAAVQSEHDTGFVGGAAVARRAYAEGPVPAVQPRQRGLLELDLRVPDE